MLSMEEVQPGSRVTHKNTRLCYSVVEAGEDEVLLSHESDEGGVSARERGRNATSAAG